MSTKSTVLTPQGRFLGMAYNFRMPTVTQLKPQFWDPDDDRLLTPMVFNWGYVTNLHKIGSRVASLAR